jgi:uncharacterized protein (DUF58 family)
MIHWRRSASLGRLVARERSTDEARRFLVVFDERLPPNADAESKERFERAVSEAASSCIEASRRGETVEVRSRGRAFTVSADEPIDPVLRFFALLDAPTNEAVEKAS